MRERGGCVCVCLCVEGGCVEFSAPTVGQLWIDFGLTLNRL